MRIKIQLFLVAICMLILQQTNAQMVIDNSQTPQQLVQDVLLGQGVVASNITYQGGTVQIGYFDASNSNFPIPEGIVMSTGDVTDVPATGATFASTIVGGGGDADLNMVSSAGTNDAVILEFDFVPTGDSIKFDYVFGSEEYPEFVNAGFNDVFAFIISGPGFNGPFANGGVNIALIPGTVTPVTIDNVNNVTNSQYYVNNANGGANGIVYDGYTVTLTALAQVQCGQTYHLKLALADGGDSSYDSGVFLEARSFSSNAFTFDIVTPSADSTIVEGCTTAEVNIYASPSDSLLAYDIIVTGNAQEGVDYIGIPDSLIIQPGDSVFSFEIEPLSDGQFESVSDTIILTIYTVNSCGDTVPNVGVVYITEDYEIDVEIAETVGPCPAYNYSILNAVINGGNPAFDYHWSTGDVTSSIEAGFPQPTQISVYVEDQCGFVSDTAYITVDSGEIPPDPTVQTSNDVDLVCPSDQATITAIANGGSAPYTYSWSPNAGQGSTVTVQPSETTEYVVTVTDNCLLVALDTVLVTVEPYMAPSVSALDTAVLCPEELVVLTPVVENGVEPFNYSWSNGSDQASISINPSATEDYILVVTDDCGNSASDTATVEVPQYDALNVSVFNTDLTMGDTITICELWKDTVVSSVTGGLSPYTYTWSGTLIDGMYVNNDTAIMSVTYELPADSSVTETYQLLVVDQCGEEITVEFPVEVISCDVVAPSIFNPESNFQGTTNFCGNTPQNNVFALPCLNLYPGNTVTIWDRWGRKCYSTTDYHLNPWDGGNQASGTYYYVCELPNGKDPVKGFFQLVR